MQRATRRELLLTGAAGALLAPATAAAATTTSAASGFVVANGPPLPEPQRLERLIRIELLLLYCYRSVLASSVLSPRARRTIAPFAGHEEAHISALERALRAHGQAAPPGPADIAAANRDLAHRNVGGRLGQLRGDLDAVRLLLTVEQVTIGAYWVALTDLTDTNVIELVCRIMGNEAQHDAMLGLLLPPGTPGSAVPYGLVSGRR
jgi:hypothetical protein